MEERSSTTENNDTPMEEFDTPTKPTPPFVLRPMYTMLVLLFGVVCGVGGLFAYQEYAKQPVITTFDECIKAKGSQQLLIYPGVCTTQDGRRFEQPRTEDERARLVPPTETIREASDSPTPQAEKPVSKKITILDTTTWTQHTCGGIAFKLPDTAYTYSCPDYAEGSKDVLISKIHSQVPNATIQIRTYDGGSRRQYWIKALSATPQEVEKYVRIQESTFGSVEGLDIFASGGWWQGGNASPILISKGKTIVQIFGGRDFDEGTGKITRWDFTDTIASTIIFL